MNIKKAAMCSVFAAAAVALGVSLIGCEVEPAGARIYISPGSSTVRKYATVRLSASGGFDYEWSLEHEEWGTLSSRRGPSVVYKSRFAPEDNSDGSTIADLIQTIYVQSYIDGAGSADSNFVSTAEALIKHVGFGLEIVPSQVAVRKGESVLFRATGGEDYIWELEQDSGSTAFGTLDTRNGPNVWYTSVYDPGEGSSPAALDLQYIDVRSSDGGTARAWVSHIATGSQLTIEEVSSDYLYTNAVLSAATFDTLGQGVDLEASGGKAGYTWTLSNTSYVNFTKSPATGSRISVIYVNEVPVSADPIIVVVEVSSGAEATRAYIVLQ